jgi:hypothetical protein
MNNEEKMVEQIEKIIAKQEELDIMRSVNESQPQIQTASYSNKGSIGNFFLGLLITAIVVGGVVLGVILAK